MKWNEIADFTNQQLRNILISDEDITPYVEKAYNRTLECFKLNGNKYYINKEEFTVFHSGQYSIFLYYLANTIFKEYNNDSLSSKIYYLNKILHSVDWFHEVELPEYWGVEHPLGSVLGRAKYDNGFFIFQGCTVGGNKKKYPKLGKNVIMYSNASILGNSTLGDNVILSAGTTIKDESIPSNSIVFGQSPNLIVKEKSYEYMQSLVDDFWIRKQGNK